MNDAYDDFINARVIAGDTAESIIAEIQKRLLPISKMCAYCKNEGTLLCDYVIGFEKTGSVTMPSKFIRDQGVTKPYERDCLSFDSQMFTCDLRICEDCRTQGAVMFFCGTGGGASVPDYCKEHAENVEMPLNEMVMTVADAQVIRSRMTMRIMAQHPFLKGS